MSDIPPEDIPLFTVIRMVRLWDRMRGTPVFTSDFFRGLEDEESKDRDLLNMIQGRKLDEPFSPKKGRDESKTLFTVKDILEYTARKYEYVQKTWESVFTTEANAVEKFLNLLEGLRLDTSSERRELKELRDSSENVLQRLATLNARIKKGEKIDDIKSVDSDLFLTMGGMNTLSETVYKMADEAIRIVALMTSSVQSNRLLELFTGEP
jgi:hypothetical protein